jgi:hypothetical protein
MSRWERNDDGSESTTKEVPASATRSGNPETEHLTTAGGGNRNDHSHVIIQHREGRDTAHAVPRKSQRKP